MKWIAGGQDLNEYDTSYMKSRCPDCGTEFTSKEIWTTEVSRAEEKEVKQRTQEEHQLLIKEVYEGSVRKYLLSMGAFKEDE